MTIALETSSAAAAGRSDPRRSRLSAFLVRHRVVIYAFLASRLALLAVGLMTQIFIEPFSSHVSTLHMTEQVALRMWGQWDTGWYLTLAAHGYASLSRKQAADLPSQHRQILDLGIGDGGRDLRIGKLHALHLGRDIDRLGGGGDFQFDGA